MKISDLEHREIFCLSAGEEAISQIKGGAVLVTPVTVAVGQGESLALAAAFTTAIAWEL